MSRRQSERGSRFQMDIEQEVRTAAAAFRDNDVEASTAIAVRLWWSSRLRGRRFAQLLRQARDVTQARISVGVVERGEPGRRQAMPYFLAVLRGLINQDRRTRSASNASVPHHGEKGRNPLPPSPPTPVPAGTRISEIYLTQSGKSD
jgi:hypothetical protein